MSASLAVQTSVNGLVNTTGQQTLTDNAAELAAPISVAAGQPATLSIRTNGTSGVLTLTNAPVGISNGQRVDLYWAGGSCYGATVSVVSGLVLSFGSVQGGTALPVVSTPITVAVPTVSPFSVIGNNVTALVLSRASAPATRCTYTFLDVNNALLTSLQNAAGQIYVYAGTGTNPLAGMSPAVVWVSQEATTADAGLSAVALNH